jgi:peptidoglycan/xylan/chitin deacetylase (PgdA/CDA1 family)
MGVLVLMYHRTPPVAGHILDVAMPLFRAQIEALQQAGLRFIRMGEALDPRWYGGETVVAITFDDGHTSNLPALAWLNDRGIPSTSFFVSGYVRNSPSGFIDEAAFRTASLLTEVGGHGATHVGLASLAPGGLEAELSASKSYLENLCGRPVTAMSAPGGNISAHVVRMALKLGYQVIGDSEPLLNTAPRLPLHRVCMLNGQSPDHVLALAQAGQVYWLRKRLRRLAAASAARALGAERLGSLLDKFRASVTPFE